MTAPMDKIISQEELPTVPFELKCRACTHMRTCSPFRGIAEMLAGYGTQSQLGSVAPFDADDLAIICTEFFPMATVDALKKQSSSHNL